MADKALRGMRAKNAAIYAALMSQHKVQQKAQHGRSMRCSKTGEARSQARHAVRAIYTAACYL
jgi:hypothetical protein